MLCVELFFPLTLALSREGRGKILEWVMPMPQILSFFLPLPLRERVGVRGKKRSPFLFRQIPELRDRVERARGADTFRGRIISSRERCYIV